MPEHPGSSSAHRFFSLSSPFKLILPESTQREVTVSAEPTVFPVRYPQGFCLLGEDGRDDEQAGFLGRRWLGELPKIHT